MTPFHLALKSGHIPTVKLLLFKGAHIEQIDRVSFILQILKSNY